MATMRTAATWPARTWWQAILVSLLALTSLLVACGGSDPPRPSISVQPSDTSVVAGNTATLSVRADGEDLTYQWQASTDGGTTWSALAGATSATYTTSATTAADNGKRYRVIVTAAGISITSSAVTLTVTVAVVAPTISVAPASTTVTAPTAALFSVTVAGTAPVYQWQRSNDGGGSWSPIAGAIGASHDTGATDVSMTGQQFRVVVGNSAGSVTSEAATLRVNAAQTQPALTQQPTDQSVVEGASVAFSVTVTGTPAPTLQWQIRNNPSVNWSDLNIGGVAQTDATVNLGATTLAQNGSQFRVVVTNAAGVTTSTVATLTVTAATQAPAITAQPTPQSVTAPATATFSAAASGIPTPTWQWQLSSDGGTTFANITGATSASYTTPATGTADSGKLYRAVATNSAGSATTNAAALAVNPTFVRTYQFNLFGFNQGPGTFLLYGGSVRDNDGKIECSGYAALADPCPKWRADFPSGSMLTLTATPWPAWRVSRWAGGDCGSPGNANTVTLIIDHNSNCLPQFALIPGSTFSLSAVPAGAWIGLVVEMVADRFGNLVVPDSPRINCGPLAAAQVCDANVEVGASPYTVMRLRALPLGSAPVGQVRWTCTSPSPDNNTSVVRTFMGSDIGIGPIYGNTACSAELVPTL